MTESFRIGPLSVTLIDVVNETSYRNRQSDLCPGTSIRYENQRIDLRLKICLYFLTTLFCPVKERYKQRKRDLGSHFLLYCRSYSIPVVPENTQSMKIIRYHKLPL